MMKYFLLLALVSALALSAVEARKCKECNLGSAAEECKESEKTCDESGDNKGKGCFKFTIDKKTVKGCSNKIVDGLAENKFQCKDVDFMQVKGRLCLCEGDNCNGAIHTAASSAATFTLVAVVATLLSKITV